MFVQSFISTQLLMFSFLQMLTFFFTNFNICSGFESALRSSWPAEFKRKDRCPFARVWNSQILSQMIFPYSLLQTGIFLPAWFLPANSSAKHFTTILTIIEVHKKALNCFLVLLYYQKTFQKTETDPQILWEWQYVYGLILVYVKVQRCYFEYITYSHVHMHTYLHACIHTFYLQRFCIQRLRFKHYIQSCLIYMHTCI